MTQIPLITLKPLMAPMTADYADYADTLMTQITLMTRIGFVPCDVFYLRRHDRFVLRDAF